MSYFRFWPIFSTAGSSSTGRRASSVAAGSRRGSPSGARTGRYQASSSVPGRTTGRPARPSAARRASFPCRPRCTSAAASSARKSSNASGVSTTCRYVGLISAAAGSSRRARRPARRPARPGCGSRTRRTAPASRSRSTLPTRPGAPSRSARARARRAGPARGSAGPARGPRAGSACRFAPETSPAWSSTASSVPYFCEQLAGRPSARSAARPARCRSSRPPGPGNRRPARAESPSPPAACRGRRPRSCGCCRASPGR